MRNPVIIVFLLLALSGAPATAATAPWHTLTPAQQEALAPLAQQWDGLPERQQHRLLKTAKRYPNLTPEQKQRFTLVLKGHIALGAVRFIKGTTGSQLDALARAPLWAEGLDYDHGTGHGVGTYLGVHEGPQRISKVGNTVALEPGMVISNEPGYYKTGAYGIRIENLVAVREIKRDGAEKPMMEFETLTLAPIDLNMVEPSLLTAEEKAWLNAYHARVRETLSPLVDAETRSWLQDATRAI